MEYSVVQNAEHGQFEIHKDGKVALLQYQESPGRIKLIHTEVPAELEGKGLAAALARHSLACAREKNLRVLPYCPFVASYIKRHSEFLDLVPESHRSLVDNAT
jgi:predicted GNAT family acetyltransferase